MLIYEKVIIFVNLIGEIRALILVLCLCM